MRGVLLLFLLYSCNVWAELNYEVKHINSLPVIDGMGTDDQWQLAQQLELTDVVADHEMYFSALHDGESIAIKVHFPDATENREHKTLVWDDTSSIYKSSSKREDTFVLKWSISPLTKDLTLKSDEPYHADIWYWKSFRTDPLGYADDKYQIYSKVPNKKAKRLRSKDGSLFFLQRRGDSGKSAYKNRILINKESNEEAKYSHKKPEGSRADVKAKGVWQDGYWTIEFQRKLDTGNSDDINLVVGNSMLLGLSRYEIAGRKPDQNLEIPYFGSGEISQLINVLLEK